MQRLIILVALVFASATISLAQPSSVSPEAEPVYNWIKAAQSGDVALLKSVWTSGTFNGYFGGDSFNWRHELRVSIRLWRKVLGIRNLKKVNLSDIEFRFEDNSVPGTVLRRGIVTVSYKRKRRESFNVEYENGKWKIPEL